MVELVESHILQASFTTKRPSSSRVVPGMEDSSGVAAAERNTGESSSSSSSVVNEGEKGRKHVATGPSLDVALAGLLILVVLCGGFSLLAYKSMNMQFVVPLDSNASLDRFSEGRAMDHILSLAEFGRQEGTPGLAAAAKYIVDELKAMKARASPEIKVEIDESFVNGSFNLRILKHSLSFSYRNHPNIAIRVSAQDAPEDAASVLFNAHFDAPLGSPGASDCASCVGTIHSMSTLSCIPSRDSATDN